MNPVLKRSLSGFGVFAVAICACEKTTNRPLGQPSTGLDNGHALGGYGSERSVGRSSTEADRESAIGGGPAEQTSPTEAAASIAEVRCDRALRCGQIGSSSKYTSRAACVVGLKKDKSAGLADRSCPGGILESALANCLEAIRNDDCGRPLDTLGRVSVCQAENFCVQPAPSAPPVPGVDSSGG